MDVGAPHTEEAHACTNGEQKMKLPLAEKGLKNTKKYINSRNKSTHGGEALACTNGELDMELPLAEKSLKKNTEKYKSTTYTRNKSTAESKRWNCHSQKRA